MSTHDLPVGTSQQAKTIVPVMFTSLADIEGEILAATGADGIEWRMDALNATDMEEYLEAGRALRDATTVPILATFRTAAQGSQKDIDPDYAELLISIASNEIADAVDVEMFCDCEWTPNWLGPAPAIKQLVTTLKKLNCEIVGSWHDFSGAPHSSEITGRLVTMAQHGADIAKIAVMPQSDADLEALKNGAQSAHQRGVKRIIAIGMGPLGVDSRIYPEHYASCATFAAGASASAPGQMTITQLLDARRH
ncbi:type I 3-dehydroquinate dehydratase [Arcanobacterium canis]|uniref:3-dehydroquinate dehydratase n=1 Tax=Arcanobacterium canis TaxID=999183 RepID=A0ABY8FWR0_9ACTO|nr:type I 3-dehydroquinate dehydratase [Arcanobacterium canis]WFM82957.1 type I 3-dehydroquinate dehydratase [Arcanobacterium canis]